TRARGMHSALCREFDVQLLAYGTVACGLLGEKWMGKPPPPPEHATWSQLKYGRFVQAAGGWEALQRILAVTHSIARKHGVSMANVACRAILDAPAVAGVIVRARLGESEPIADHG